jgi:hypothetical protein
MMGCPRFFDTDPQQTPLFLFGLTQSGVLKGLNRSQGGSVLEKAPGNLVFFVEKRPEMLRANEQKMMKYLVK